MVASIRISSNGMAAAGGGPGEMPLRLQSGRFAIFMEAPGGGAKEAVAAFQDCSGLTVEVTVQDFVEGGNNEYVHKLPGPMKYGNITLKRGMSDSEQFLKWRPRIEGGKIVVTRKNVLIVVYDIPGKPVKQWEVKDAYPSKWTGPDFKSSSFDVLIESIEIAHRGFKETTL